MSGAGNATTMTPNPVGSVPAAAVGAASLAAALVKGQETIRQAPGRLYEPRREKTFCICGNRTYHAASTFVFTT